MFELTKTFTHTTGFSITPIEMQGVGFIFLTQELQEQLGYENLSDMVRQSDSFAEGIEYVILRNSNLKSLKDLLNWRNSIPPVRSTIYETLKHSPALIVLTESGLYTTMFLSRKPGALDFRRWVTGEVLPSIRKTGMYQIMGTSGLPQLVPQLMEKINSLDQAVTALTNTIADQQLFQDYVIQGFERVEAILAESLPHDMFEGYEKIRKLVENMTLMYDLSKAERKRYTRVLCQTNDVPLPEKALVDTEAQFYVSQELASKIGVYSTTNRPHSRLVLALIRHLNLDQDRYRQPFSMARRSYNTTICKYSDNVIPHLVEWLQEKKYPATIEIVCGTTGKIRKFRVKYRRSQR